MSDFHISSNLLVVQNGRFVINPIYLGGSTMVAKFLEFGLSESLKMRSPEAFCSSKLSLESWILHCLLCISVKTIIAFVDTDLKLMMKMVDKSNAGT